MRHGIIILLCLLSLSVAQQADIQVEKIWDEAAHNAFTDLVRFQGKFYCVFREGSGHIPGTDGVIRILGSRNGKRWKSVAILRKDRYDLRDPKITIHPDGKLMVLMGGSDYQERELQGLLPHVSFSDSKGKVFSEPVPIQIDPDIRTHWDWLWRVKWHEGKAYGVVYVSGGINSLYLVQSTNGINYERVHTFNVEGLPNEASLEFGPEGDMFMFLRRGGGNQHGFFGQSTFPYTSWTWTDLGFRVGGPHVIRLPFEEETFAFGTRLYLESGARTRLLLGDRQGRLEEAIRLPSGGDTSYPGIVVHKSHLYMSYYSSHEGKTSIYFAKIPLKMLQK